MNEAPWVRNTPADYGYRNAELTWSSHYLWPVLRRQVEARDWPQKRAFEIGCRNGAIANLLSTLGFRVTGIDPSESGIAQEPRPRACRQVGRPPGPAVGRRAYRVLLGPDVTGPAGGGWVPVDQAHPCGSGSTLGQIVGCGDA
jgi:SAM-dependent methyltransferase